MTYPAKTIANYFIFKSKSESLSDLTPMKLLKLVYIAHGWHLAIKNEPLIFESIDAWKYGPVIETLYHEFKRYKNNPISELTQAPSVPDEDESTRKILNDVWSKYAIHTGVQLSNWSHEPGSPWHQTWHDKNGKSYNGLPISNQIIQEYFSKI